MSRPPDSTPADAAKAEAVDAAKPDPKKPAAEVEVDGDEKITFEWQGFTLTVPASIDDWDGEALESFETGKAISAVRGLLGTTRLDQIKREFLKQHGRAMRVKDYGEIVEAVADRYGFNSPE